MAGLQPERQLAAWDAPGFKSSWLGAACAAACIATLACGGGSPSRPSPTSPAPAPAPAPPTTPTNTWNISGAVVDTVTRASVGGALIAPSWELDAVSSGDDGAYSLGAVVNPPVTPYELTVSADGFLARKLFVNWQSGARTGVTLDLIRLVAPFSLEYYQQLVRGTYDNDGPWPVLRWTEAPSFYVKTVDQNGRPIEPEVLVVVLDALARAVPAYTGGVYSAAAIETGTTERPAATGWIAVNIIRDPDQRRTCGTSYVGRNPGEITLYNDVCSCGSVKIPGSLVMHEVGHALGFFHVPDRDSVMYPFIPNQCPAGALPLVERYHAAIAYARPRGNTDPDNDPASFGLFGPPPAIGPPIKVKN